MPSAYSFRCDPTGPRGTGPAPSGQPRPDSLEVEKAESNGPQGCPRPVICDRHLNPLRIRVLCGDVDRKDVLAAALDSEGWVNPNMKDVLAVDGLEEVNLVRDPGVEVARLRLVVAMHPLELPNVVIGPWPGFTVRIVMLDSNKVCSDLFGSIGADFGLHLDTDPPLKSFVT